MTQRILVAGIGNIFFGDDAFGGEVVRHLLRDALPDGVHVKDFGIRSLDLAYEIMDGYEAVILLDATTRGEPPGTLYLIQPELEKAPASDSVDPHSINAVTVLQMVKTFGACPGKVYLLGCEPQMLETDQLGLSVVVQDAVPRAAAMVRELISHLVGKMTVGEKTAPFH
jgi:hydrogenase maturation protease